MRKPTVLSSSEYSEIFAFKMKIPPMLCIIESLYMLHSYCYAIYVRFLKDSASIKL